jgi:ABC-2 type transport system ATP-binding protein
VSVLGVPASVSVPALDSAPAPIGWAPTASAAEMPLVLTSVTKSWRGNTQPVLDGVDLALAAGTLTWVGGANGAGKTTLLRIAAGLIAPDRGSAQVWGRSPSCDGARFRRLVAFLPAGDRGLYARLTVVQQLTLTARLWLLNPDHVEAIVDGAIEQFALRELARRRVDRLSMGQRQRVRLAATFMVAAPLVLLDEPLTSLDSDGAEMVRDAIEDVRSDGGAVLWCSPTGERPPCALDRALTLTNGTLGRA